MARNRVITFRAPDADYQRIHDAAQRAYGKNGLSQWLLEAALKRLEVEAQPGAPAYVPARLPATNELGQLRAQVDYIANHLGIALPVQEPAHTANTAANTAHTEAHTANTQPSPPAAAPARRRLDTDPKAMAIILQRYEEGVAPAAVAQELNRAGYRTGGGKTWDKASVSETGYRARRAAAKAKGKGKSKE